MCGFMELPSGGVSELLKNVQKSPVLNTLQHQLVNNKNQEEERQANAFLFLEIYVCRLL